MRTKRWLGIGLLCFCLYGFIGCNKNEEAFSGSEIRRALFDMKGTYHGTTRISYYQGSAITELRDAMAISRDSLKYQLSLLPIAELVAEESVAERLREIGEVQVVAGYDFLQMDSGAVHFRLQPEDVIVWGGYGAPATIRIVFSQNFGGDAVTDQNFMMFNLTPMEIWMDGAKCEGFSQLVYHFQGEYE